MAKDILPIAVIGAGPVGLAAAAHLAERGERFIVFESGDTAGATVRQWAHVRMFSPWSYNVDPASVRLLTAQGWTMPTATESADAYPTGDDLVARYLRPLSQHPQIAPHVRDDARVLGIGRLGLDRTKTGGRESAPFVLRVAGARGDGELDILARGVIDASGTFRTPNPLGAHGYPAIGELTLSRSDADVDGQRDGDRQIEIEYGLPDVLGSARARYAGRRVLVAGSGHSAMNVLLDLGQLAAVDAETEANATHVTWVVRRSNLNTLYGAGDRDQLPERGRLGTRLHTLVDSGHLHVVTDFRITRVTRTPDGIVASNGTRDLAPVDIIVAATGFRPDLDITRELRLALDPIVESPPTLAALIDPNIHSCGTVPPHAAQELQHPEPHFFIVGMKSYGRVPTFLLRTRYEQVRSVCALTGNEAGARRLELTLPETGVCCTSQLV